MILYALPARASKLRNRRGTWRIDNAAALMLLVRGRSDSSDLERLSSQTHTAVCALQVWIFWERVPSKSNWSDSISRLGVKDPWFRASISPHSMLTSCSPLGAAARSGSQSVPLLVSALGVQCVG